MSWKNEIITSAEQAEDFLTKQIMAAVPEAYIACEQDAYFSFRAATEKHGNVFVLDIERGPNLCKIHDLYVHKDYRGNKLSDTAIKATCGIACDQKAPCIFIEKVRDDGISFWPGRGATCYDVNKMMHVGHLLPPLMNMFKKQIPRQDYQRLAAAALNFNKDPLLALHEIAAVKACAKGDTRFTKILFEPICRNQNMVINLTKEPIQHIIENRVGRLPSFKELLPEGVVPFTSRSFNSGLKCG